MIFALLPVKAPKNAKQRLSGLFTPQQREILARAMFENVTTGRFSQGGSTLTQQLAKNLFLKPDRTIERKVQEVLLAFWLEQKYTKDQIMAMYLNRVFFGSNAYGVEAAARRYFNKSADADATSAATK